ncbi:TonB-dependent receptor [Chitinivorax sp. PXF-14]|uniref:TonB-dependent receptor n=1 Tax=Chitinivorax sp. PXF-14 TaxID=3230488 RepID=UPI0034662C31
MKMKRLAFAIATIGYAGAINGIAYAEDSTDQPPPQKAERIEVTGSSIKRVAKEGALPVTVVRKEDIARTGATNVEELVQSITSTSAVGGTSTAQGAGLSTYGMSSVSMRGLGGNRTLVLVNGRRLANYATDGTTVDINSIPLSSIERVEVLRDGASSVYGSDAVAGVINFIMRKNYNGFEASAYTGSPTRSGGGQINKAGFVAGTGDLDENKFNLVVSGDFSHDRALYGANRTFAKRGWNEFFDSSATPSGRLQAPWAMGVPFNQQNLKTLGNPAESDCSMNGSAMDDNYGTCRYDPSDLVPLAPTVDRGNLSANFRFALSPAHELYSTAIYTRTKTVTLEQYSPYSPVFLGTDNAFLNSGIEQSILIGPSNPVYNSTIVPYLNSIGMPQYIGQPLAVSYRAYDGGRREHTDTADQWHFVAGMKGTFGAWDYDAAYVFNQSKVQEDTNGGYQLQTKLVDLLNKSNTFNPFTTFQDAALAEQIKATNYNGMMVASKLTNQGVDGKLSGAVFELPSGSLSAAVGVGAHKETLDFTSSAAAQGGDVSGYGAALMPYNKSRNNHSMFAEVNVPIVKHLEADVAVRSDHYETIGSETTPKVSLRWQPLQQFLLRGSWGKGFRAPSLPELYTPIVVSSTSQFTDPVTGEKNQFNQTAGGSPDLKPEHTKQMSFGFVVEPVSGVSAGVDFFRVKVEDQILSGTGGALSAQAIVGFASEGNSFFAPLVQRACPTCNIQSIKNTALNGGNLDVAGVDIDLRWRVGKTEMGAVDVGLNGTYFSKYDSTDPSGATQHAVARTVDDAGNILNPTQQGGVIMRWKHELTAGVTNATWSASVTQNFQNGYWDFPDNDGAPHWVGSFATYDLQGNYTAIKNLKLTLGVKNVFDSDPPRSNAGVNVGYFQSGYDPSYYDPRGRFIYGSVNYKFK